MANKAKSDLIERQKMKWINNGGPFYMKDPTTSDPKKPRICIPSQATFFAFEEDIPKGFRDSIKLVDPTAMSGDKEIVNVVLGFHMQKREGSDLYDILDGADKKINEKGLTEEAAKNLLENLI